LGMTNNISCEGLSFTFQNFALEPGQRLQFKLKQPRTNVMISFLGDIIWQEQKDIKYAAGVKLYDVNKKNKKVMLKVISDSCNIPVNSLLDSNDTVKLLSDELISRIPNRYRSKFSGLYRTSLIFATTATVLFIPAVIENFKDGSNKPITQSIKSMAITNTNKMKDVSKIKNGQTNDRNTQTVNNSVPLQTVKNSNLYEVLEKNNPSAIKEKEPDIKLPVNIKDLTGGNKFFIQVASFKDADIAHGILSELKQDYPAAYIFPQNDFYKVRIPDIKTSEQGYAFLKDIEMKFNLKPILVERVQ
jgi:cell division septation protein DedD